jgi:anaerobic ribonucleoside-triphosphate reductase activating protein
MMVPHTSDHGCRRKSGLNLAGFLAKSAVNGPGIRAVIWVQGCPIHCKGCFNPAFWSFSPAMVVSMDEIARRIRALRDIDGVTFSGGEPFAQADALAAVGERIREMGHTVVTYTGYTYEHLLSGRDPAWNRLLGVTDLLIAGPYIRALSCSSPFVGSSNQQLIYLTEKIPRDPRRQYTEGEVIEFSIDASGTTTITGFPGEHGATRIASRCRGG